MLMFMFMMFVVWMLMPFFDVVDVCVCFVVNLGVNVDCDVNVGVKTDVVVDVGVVVCAKVEV